MLIFGLMETSCMMSQGFTENFASHRCMMIDQGFKEPLFYRAWRKSGSYTNTLYRFVMKDNSIEHSPP